jgi:hypothetical protein
MKRQFIEGQMFFTLDMKKFKRTLLGSLSYLYDKPTKDMTDKELDWWHEILESNKD